jgi:hypothetical protein
VSINGGAPVILKQRTTAVNVTMSIPFEAYLEKGAVNNITVTGTSAGMPQKKIISLKETNMKTLAGPAADFDRLIVYPHTP